MRRTLGEFLPKLTITYGVRYTLLQTPYETKGQEVAPTIDTHAWYNERETAALQGQIYEPDLTFTPAGKYYGKPGFYPENKNNFAPRLAIVYSPDTKTTFRAGAGIYFDHFGEGLIDTFDQNGAFGISSSVTNQAGTIPYESAARFTGTAQHSIWRKFSGIPNDRDVSLYRARRKFRDHVGHRQPFEDSLHRVVRSLNAARVPRRIYV
jgi:hypothetical protein